MKSRTEQGQLGAFIIEAEATPLGALSSCREAFKSLRSGYRTGLYEILAGGFAIAVEFGRGHTREWRRFCNDPFWKENREGRPTDRHNCLLSVLHRVFGGTQYNRAWKYARGLELYLQAGIEPKQVARQLKMDGGIEKLYRRAVQDDPRQEKNEGNEDNESDSKGDTDSTDGQPEENGRKVLVVELETKRPERLSRLRDGEAAELRVRRVKSRNRGVLRFRAEKVRRSEKLDQSKKAQAW